LEETGKIVIPHSCEEEIIVKEAKHRPLTEGIGPLGMALKDHLEKSLSYQKDSDIICRIKSALNLLEKKITALSGRNYASSGGAEYIVEILKLVNSVSEKQILEVLADENPGLAEDVNRRIFGLDDIYMLDNRATQLVLRELDSQDLVKALYGMDDEVKDKIFVNMSRHGAEMIKEDIKLAGPIKLEEAEEARQKICRIILHLDEIGEIVLPFSRENELIA